LIHIAASTSDTRDVYEHVTPEVEQLPN